MGTAQVQGELWGIHARDWADLQEKMLLPAYKVVFEQTQVGVGTRLLDVGCGTGLAAQLAAKLGAQVTGIDASEAELTISRERVPNGDFRCGEMEALPFDDASFDVVTGFNSFQYAANPVNALREAKRVVRPGGFVAMVTWGRAEDCEYASIISAVMAHLPPPPPGAEGPFALSAPGRLETLLTQAGLAPQMSGDVSCPFEYPDEETALKAASSPGIMVQPERAAGEMAIKQTILASLQPYKTASGGYRQQNSFRYIIATA